MGGPRLDYFALRPMTIGATTYAVGDVVDVSAMSNDTVTGLMRSGYLASTLKGDIRSAVVQATEPTSPEVNDLWIDSDAVAVVTAMVTRQTTQSIPGSTVTSIEFGTENWDTDGMVDLATSTTNVIVQTAGKYRIIGRIRYAGNTTGVDRQARIHVNGSVVALSTVPPKSSGGETITNVLTEREMSVSDVLTLAAFQDSGGALDACGASEYAWGAMSVTKIAS